MQDFNYICEKYNSVNLKIVYKWKGKEEKITFCDILPKNFCILAFHSVYGYIQTIFSGGWFNWVNYNEFVIVNCPSPKGVAMYVKNKSRNSSGNFQIEVMKADCGCNKKYNFSDTFPISFNEKGDLRYKMLDRIIPFITEFLSENSSPKVFSCIYNGDIIEYEVEVIR